MIIFGMLVFPYISKDFDDNLWDASISIYLQQVLSYFLNML